MVGKDTNEMLAIRFPHSYHLFEELDEACGIAKTQNSGFARIDIVTQGIDFAGKLIVKGIDIGLHLRRRKEK